MAIPNLTELRRLARQRYLDVSTVKPALEDAEHPVGSTKTDLDDLINSAYFDVYFAGPQQVTQITHSSLWTAGSLAIGASTLLTLTDRGIQEFLHCYRETSSGLVATGPELEHMEVWEILDLIQTDTTPGPPTRFAALRRSAFEGGVQGAGAWRGYFHPVPAVATFISAQCIAHPLRLTSGANIPDLTEEEGFIVADLAAVYAAHALQRPPEFIARLWESVPSRIQQAVRSRESGQLTPRQRPQEQTA